MVNLTILSYLWLHYHVGLRERHFKKISDIVGFEVRNDDATCFRQLLRLQVNSSSMSI
jgi:hypothetical protein